MPPPPGGAMVQNEAFLTGLLVDCAEELLRTDDLTIRIHMACPGPMA